MSRPTKTVVQREIRRLRRLIDKSVDPLCYRIAQGMEDCLRWAIEDTERWGSPANEVARLADLLRNDLAVASARAGGDRDQGDRA